MEKRRQRGGGVAFRRSRRRGEGRREEGPAPVVFKDLDAQRGDEREEAVGDVSEDQLLVGVAADTDVGGAGLKQRGERGRE